MNHALIANEPAYCDRLLGEAMPKYRQKPVVVEAAQWFPTRPHRHVVTPLAPATCRRFGIELRDRHLYGTVATTDGPMLVSPGDWIVQGPRRTFFPVHPAIFADLYEPAHE